MNRIAVLHVEDDSNDVMLFEHAWQRVCADFALHSVQGGDEAIAYLKGVDKFNDRDRYPMPRLMLLDLKMPRLDGFDVLEWVRLQTELRRLPVVVLTSSNHELDVKRAYDAGANSYLVKPLSFDGLVDVVKAIQHYWLTLNAQPD